MVRIIVVGIAVVVVLIACGAIRAAGPQAYASPWILIGGFASLVGLMFYLFGRR